VRGFLTRWAVVATVGPVEGDLTFTEAFTQTTGLYAFSLLSDTRYLDVRYDQYEETSPEESFEILLTYTNLNGGGPYMAWQVPAAPFQTTTTFDFDAAPETYSVTLDERPAP